MSLIISKSQLSIRLSKYENPFLINSPHEISFKDYTDTDKIEVMNDFLSTIKLNI